MKRIASYTGLVATLLLFVASCGESEEPMPDDLMPRDTFVALMIDIQLVEGIKSQFTISKNQKYDLAGALYRELLERHEVSEDDFMRAYTYYQGRPELMEQVYEQVLDSLSTLEAEIKQEYAKSYEARRDSSVFLKEDSQFRNYQKSFPSGTQPAQSRTDTTDIF